MILLGFTLQNQAQNKTEYRYWSLIVGMNHGFGSKVNESSDFGVTDMIHTNHGDMKFEKGGISYTPGYHVGLLYNYDFYNNKTGILAGIEFANYGTGCSLKSSENDGKYKLNEHYRAMAVEVPILLKFGPRDIYRNMGYITLGAKVFYNINAAVAQVAKWEGATNAGHKLEKSQTNGLGYAICFGGNYKMFSFNLNYMLKNCINTGEISHVGKSNLFVCTSLNIPMTRWLSVNNWTAEKIRRKLHHN